MDDYKLKVIARIHSDFPTKFGIPRQSGLVDELRATIVFEPEYRNEDALRGLEEFSHIWLIWSFSENVRDSWSPTVRPPRLGGNSRMGVFATRSSFRPNALGLSSVRLLSVERHPQWGPTLVIAGADIMDGTPIFDIKPYLLTTDCHPEASKGFTALNANYTLPVEIPEKLQRHFPKHTMNALRAVLAQDPRPAYQHDENREYKFTFANLDVTFSVKDNTVVVLNLFPAT